jgi:hypothetical protein
MRPHAAMVAVHSDIAEAFRSDIPGCRLCARRETTADEA